MADLKSARPIAGLPGLGSEFWKATTAHLLNDVDSVAAQCLVPSTSEGTLVSDMVAQNLIQHWSAFSPLAKDCPKYTTMFEKAEVGTIAGFTALKIPVQFHSSGFQDGSAISDDAVTYFHGTRSLLVPSICLVGLQPSQMSHGETGIWINSCVTDALFWNSTLFDIFPHLVLEVLVSKSCIVANRRVRAGSSTRAVAVANKVRIQHIIVLRPPEALIEFQDGLRRAILLTITDFHPNLDSQNANDTANEVWQMAAARYSHRQIPGAFDTSYSLNTIRIAPLVSCLSLLMASILAAMVISNPCKRAERLRAHHWSDIPTAIKTWLNDRFPGINICFNQTVNLHPPTWNLVPMWSVQPWGSAALNPDDTVHESEKDAILEFCS